MTELRKRTETNADADLARDRFESALAQHEPEFGRFFLARLLDLTISYDDERLTCRVDVPLNRHFFNPQGSLHGGIVSTVMDISMGHLCHRYLSTAVTLEMKTTYLDRVLGPCWAEGKVLKPGRRIVQLESHLYNENDQLAAHATSTYHRIHKMESKTR